MRPIVHIGYHKTATSWFQQCFYPVLGDRYVPRERVYDALVRPHALDFDTDRARRTLGAERRGLILCEEELSGYVHNGGLRGHASSAMARRIKETLPDARIVLFVRDQPAMIASCYQQYVRAGGTHGPLRYVLPHAHLPGASGDPFKVPRFELDHFRYDRLARLYAELFGRESVHVFPYEALRANRTDFLPRFARTLGLEMPWDSVSLGVRNRSYGRAAMRLARGLNHFTRRAVADKHCLLHIPYLYTARRWLLEEVNRLPHRALRPEEVLGAELTRWLQQAFWDSNRRLADDFGLDLASHGYAVAAPNRPVSAPRPPRLRQLLAN